MIRANRMMGFHRDDYMEGKHRLALSTLPRNSPPVGWLSWDCRIAPCSKDYERTSGGTPRRVPR